MAPRGIACLHLFDRGRDDRHAFGDQGAQLRDPIGLGRIVGDQNGQLIELRTDLRDGRVIGFEIGGVAGDEIAALAVLGVLHAGEEPGQLVADLERMGDPALLPLLAACHPERHADHQREQHEAGRGQPDGAAEGGGPRRNRLFITATKSLYSVFLGVSGAQVP